MTVHCIKQGLNLPISGRPRATLDEAPPGREIALLAADYVGLRPKFHVRPGDPVRRGDLLFEDKQNPGVRCTAPATGRVLAVHRGAKRRFESLVVELSEAERSGANPESQVEFATFQNRHPSELSREAVADLLLESGEWVALRSRPFSSVANPRAFPASIFVTALDTQPLAPPTDVILGHREQDLELGLQALAKLTDGPVWICTDSETALSVPSHEQFRLERFTGPHPAGTVGLHIHRLDPVDRDRFVWHLGLQDVLAIGSLFGTGQLDVDRIVALAGPAVRRPRLLRTRRGASTEMLCTGELGEGNVRVLSGSVLAGRQAMGEVHGFLGRYHQQVCAIHEQREREFLGWMAPGRSKYSSSSTFLSRFLGRRSFDLGSSTGGSPRAIIPLGVYEKVLPWDLEPTFLLKAIMMRDVDWAVRMGCLELDEEDLALCAFVCPGKSDFGGHLREVLNVLEDEAP